MRRGQREPIEDVVTRYFQYPELTARMERDLEEITGQLSELEELMREDALMTSQGVARTEAAPPARAGSTSDPVPAIMEAYQVRMGQAQAEQLALRHAQQTIRREIVALMREQAVLHKGMELLEPWAREFLEMRYHYPTHEYKQIAMSCEPEIDESTVRHHIARALDWLKGYFARFAPGVLTAQVAFTSRYVPAVSRFF